MIRTIFKLSIVLTMMPCAMIWSCRGKDNPELRVFCLQKTNQWYGRVFVVKRNHIQMFAIQGDQIDVLEPKFLFDLAIYNNDRIRLNQLIDEVRCHPKKDDHNLLVIQENGNLLFLDLEESRNLINFLSNLIARK